jgi:Protein of unknown function (DUF1364)
MTNLRDEARGRDCQIRVPTHCLFSGETVVGCHYRMSGLSGAGHKSPDWLIAWGCFPCHQIVDGQRNSTFTPIERRLLLAEGVFRTQAILFAEGKLGIT